MTKVLKTPFAHRSTIIVAGIVMCATIYAVAPAHSKDSVAKGSVAKDLVAKDRGGKEATRNIDWAYPPEAPNGASDTMVVPAKNADGFWMTPNIGISDGEALFHLRAGLNVAALACRGMAYEQALIDNYNALQIQHKAAIAQAERAATAGIAKRTGIAGNAGRDRMGTKLYNYFATPPVQKNFCPVAFRISGEVRTMNSAELTAKAPALLREIEAPFQSFYTAYAQYRADMKSWTAANGISANGTRYSPTASYQAKIDAYKVAQAQYEVDKKAYTVAYAKWEADVKACRAGDRSRCAPPAVKVAQKQ